MGEARRDVLFVGLCGPSAAGKSTVSSQVAATLDSPILPVQADWFFKSRLPSCPRCKRCWELPSSVDSALLLSKLKLLSSIFTTAETVPSITIDVTKGRQKCLDAEGLTGRSLDDKPVYIVVEGFLLFADAELCELFAHCLWLDLDCATAALRRFIREGNSGPYDDTNHALVRYREERFSHIYGHYEEFSDLMLRNSGEKLVARVVASQTAEKVASVTVAALLANIGGDASEEAATPEPGTGPAPVVAAFRSGFAREQRFQWILPAWKDGGCFWLSRRGLHEIRKAGGPETPESPCSIEMVGASAFVFWRYGHVYMLHQDLQLVFVFTGRDRGVTHVACAEPDAAPSIEKLDAPEGGRKIGFVIPGVQPSSFWYGSWHWDARVGGYDGHFELGSREETFHVTETKEWRGRMRSFCNEVMFITPFAFLMPRFGHVYLLDVEADVVQVWNGQGLMYQASRMDQESKVLMMFRSWDADGNSLINDAEFKRVLVSLGFPQDDVPALFAAADANRDGHVDYAEFLKWIWDQSPDAVQALVS